MRLARVFVVGLTIFGLSTAAFAGDLRESIAKAQQQTQSQEQTPAPAARPARGLIVPGAALFTAGMSMAVYGFLHTNGGDFTSGQVSTESRTGMGAAGLGLAAVGGALLFLGSRHVAHAPSVTLAPHRLTVQKQLTW